MNASVAFSASRLARLLGGVLVLAGLFFLLLQSAAWAGTISGHVRSLLDSRPVSGLALDVTVQVNNDEVLYGSAVTSADGSYLVPDLPVGLTYQVATVGALALGYQDAAPEAVGVNSVIDFYLKGARVLSGLVENELGQPVGGVMVSVESMVGTWEGRAVSEGNGHFSIGQLWPLPQRISVGQGPNPVQYPIPRGYEPQWWNNRDQAATADIVDLSSTASRDITVVLKGTRVMQGSVWNSSGEPLSGIRVGAYLNPSAPVKEVVTGSDGTFWIDGMPPAVVRAGAFDTLGRYFDEWYLDKSDFNLADLLDLGALNVPVDFHLALKPTTTTTTTSTTLPTTTTTSSTTSTTSTTTTTSTTLPSGPTFVDVPVNHPYYLAIEGLAADGSISGYALPDGKKEFRPSANVWRAQFAKMIDGALDIAVTEGTSSPFTDMGPNPPADLYPHDYVAAAYGEGIIKGFDTLTFGPFEDITRAQVLSMVVRALQALRPGALQVPPVSFAGSLGDFSPDHAANARLAEFNGLTTGLVGFGPSWSPWEKMTRGEVAQVLIERHRAQLVVSSHSLVAVPLWPRLHSGRCRGGVTVKAPRRRVPPGADPAGR